MSDEKSWHPQYKLYNLEFEAQCIQKQTIARPCLMSRQTKAWKQQNWMTKNNTVFCVSLSKKFTFCLEMITSNNGVRVL